MGASEKFRKLYASTHSWFHGQESKPTPEGRCAYEMGASFHGFRAAEEDEAKFDATFRSVFVRALLDSGPVFFFVPKTKAPWVLDQIRKLTRSAIGHQPGSKGTVAGCLKRMTVTVPPWGLDKEPTEWAAFGFGEADDVLLPEWCKSKLL